LRWLSPRPTAKVYTALYAYDNYFAGEQAIEDYAHLAQERFPYFADRLTKIEDLLAQRSGLSILDIGAATGEFVHLARGRGHDASGIEISAGAREIALKKYNIQLFEEGVENFVPHTLYDVIHMNHVLEHMPYPDQILTKCWDLLKPQGLLVVEVPQQFDNDLDRLRRFLHLHKLPIFNNYSLHHTYFFTPKTIKSLLVSKHFSIILLTTANSQRTPFFPINLKNLFLRYYLMLSDRLHKGGNIIEIFSKKNL
jgi:2-polyprenyl-3-methyl-5-hydroxy-6-metoxy-1,4-benzoquinol methylase